MMATSDPNLMVGGFGLGLLALAFLWRLIAWIREAPQTPDPWDAEVEQKLQDPDVRQVCHRCLTPQEPEIWFCKHCGAAVGPYNNLMPFLNVFSEGEVLRNGVSAPFRNRRFIALGYCLITLGFFLQLVLDYPLLTVGIFAFFGLAYLGSVLRNLKRPANRPVSEEMHDPQSS
ncbi:MAG TPA: hypothetical protein VG077_03685 [Verrucomicrobiae bacterium]|nr:hypothetical protein [Verrucomicrobiae bacterium]